MSKDDFDATFGGMETALVEVQRRGKAMMSTVSSREKSSKTSCNPSIYSFLICESLSFGSGKTNLNCELTHLLGHRILFFLCILRKRGRGFSPLIIDYHFEVRRQRELLLRLEEEMTLVRKQREQVGHLYFS